MAVLKRRSSVLLASALALALLPGAGGLAQAAPAAGESSRPLGKVTHHRVTLLTGDRVDVITRDGKQTPRVTPGKGRAGMTFAVSRIKGHLNVIPADAMPLLAAGKLDRRLFDVSGLIKFGYDDRRRKSLPLLVQGSTSSTAATQADDAGGTITRRLASIDAAAVTQPKSRLAGFWSDLTPGVRTLEQGVEKIWLDGKRKALLDKSVPQIGAPSAWQAGYTGKGVKVGVLDTGIDASHPDFAGQILAKKDFSGSGTTNDEVGHGTHVASTIAGTGAAGGGKYKGVAPGSKLLVGKVCGDQYCEESAILAGMEWAANSGAKVVNISLGGTATPGYDPLESAVDELSADGKTLFVIAAGNEGEFGDETIGSPASADSALAVGAVDKSDKLAEFSSRGPRVGDGALKPEITAPGVGIVAANAKDGFLGEPGEKYAKLSGTSMATPHVVGAAAILAQKHSTWKGQQLKSHLVGSAKKLPDLGAYAQGAGRVDMARAVKHSKYATPATVSAGTAVWPHDDDKAVTKSVKYTNPTSQPVTYALKLSTAGPDGKPAPEGMFAASAESVTVPAKGSKSVTVTVDPAVQSPDGYYSAWLTAAAGTGLITTPIAVNKEVESYNLIVDLTDDTGRPASSYFLVAINLDTGKDVMAFGDDGAEKFRLPKGRYHVFSFLDTVSGPGQPPRMALMTQPEYVLDKSATLGMDAREAKPVSVKLDRPDVKSAMGAVGYTHRYNGESTIGVDVLGEDFSGTSTKHVGPDLPADEFVTTLTSAWFVPGPDGEFGTSTRTYDLAFFERGHLVTGFDRTVKEQDLAASKATYRYDRTGKPGTKLWFASPTGIDWAGGWATGASMKLPVTRTEFHTVDGVDWSPELWFETVDDFFGILAGDADGHEAGKVYPESWNNAVFGPSMSAGVAARNGDEMLVGVPMHSDGSGHGGGSALTKASTVLYRDGTKVADDESAGYLEYAAPAADASYRLTVTSARDASNFTREQSATWKFRSAHTGGEQLLPLMSVGFAPTVDRYNLARAGQTLEVPVRISTQEGELKTVKSLAVDASFDDGKTWTKVPVSHSADGYRITVKHPAGKKYVSLRATAVDDDGNSVQQRIVRAYGLR